MQYENASPGSDSERRAVAEHFAPHSREQLQAAAFAVFGEWLEATERKLPPAMRILLCLDEYERLETALAKDWGAQFLDWVRHTHQHHPKFAVMLTGSRTFEELGPAWTDRFISARRIRVSFLTFEEIRPLLTKSIPEFDLDCAPGTLEAIFTATNGQPFLTQAVAFCLVQLLNETKRRRAELADVEIAIERALAAAGEYFANVQFDAGDAGNAMMLALARGETPPEDRATRQRLRDLDVLTDAGAFAVPMMRMWTARKANQF
jgi:hypothetical protein